MSKERYQENRKRVFEIYGIDPNDRRYNCHHIIFRSDLANLRNLPQGYCDSKANLYPLKVEEHIKLHLKVEQMENRVIYRAKRRRTKKRRR